MSEDRGVFSAGLMMKLLPAAMAGPILWQARLTGVIERRDAQHGADGQAARKTLTILAGGRPVDAEYLATDAPRFFAGDCYGLQGASRFADGGFAVLAAFQDHRLDHFVKALPQQARHIPQDLAAAVAGQLARRFKAAGGRRQGIVHISSRGHGDRADHAAIVGEAHFHHIVAAAPFSADQVLLHHAISSFYTDLWAIKAAPIPRPLPPPGGKGS